MNILGLDISASLFQQNNQKEPSVGDVSMPAFSASRGVSKSSEKSTKETSHDVNLQEHQISEETFQKASDDAAEFSRTASGIDKLVGSTSNTPNQPRKRNKKKNKKRKFDKKQGNSNATLPSVELLYSTVKVVQASKEANDSLVHDELASENNSRCSESIFRTAGSEDISEFTDDEFLPEKVKENSEVIVAPHGNADCRRLARTQTTVDALNCHCFTNNHKQLRKENRHYIWKKTEDIEVKQACSRIYNQNALEDMREFFTPECTGRRCLHGRVSGFDFVGPETSSHARVRLESSHCLSHQSFRGRPRKYTTRSWGGYSAVSFTWKMSEDGLTRLFIRENGNHIKRYWVSKENLSKLQLRKYFAEGEAPNVPRADLYRRSACSRTDIHDNSRRLSDSFDACKVQLAPSFLAHASCLRSNGPWTRSSGHQKLLHEIQLRAGTKVPLSVDISAGASQAFMVVEDKASASPANRLPYDSTKEEWATSSVSSQMQVSLPTNYSSTCQTSTNIGGRLAAGNQQTNIPIRIGSRMAVQVLDAAFRTQLDSDGFQLATERPIAEFERLLRDISPVINRPFVWHNVEGSIGNQPITIRLNRSDYPKVQLRNVWSWYKTFSYYGLKFKTGVSQKSKAPCHAYFCPMLSAVQLFGRPQHSSSVNFSYPNSPVGVSAFHSKHSIQPCSPIEPSDEPELIFQYFEKESPRVRKPLDAKIGELLAAGASNTYGNPIGLGKSNLQDLHPASWFSVAWYPIYQIPGGDLKAKFLTYHSFGHLVVRPANPHLAVFPALGMISNEAEGWLDPIRLPESPSGGMPFDSSQIVAARLRTLNETAKLFAKGEVLKDKEFVRNRQSDYEFGIAW